MFALGDDDADSRIEEILEHDSSPATLNVVSSDRRIRQAASRRRAKPLTADDFWDRKDHLQRPTRPLIDVEAEPDRDRIPDPAEAEHWLRAFREVEDFPGVGEIRSPGSGLLTEAEIAEIQRTDRPRRLSGDGGSPGGVLARAARPW